jgi:hypothetical protein
MATMDIRAVASHRTVAPPSRVATAVPRLEAFQGVAWFDLNGDGKIDNVPTLYGGDAYLDPGVDASSLDDIANRLAFTAPTRPDARGSKHAPTSQPVAAHQLARARAAYEAHGATPAPAR